MKVKMVDVARKLGLSKATVSLAINGKPGVSEDTRKKILDCMKAMERGEDKKEDSKERQRVIKVVVVNHRKQVVCDPERDLWSEVLALFDSESRRRNYLFSITYMNESENNSHEIIAECNMEIVAGVILFGTEMQKEDEKICRQIHKPLVIYDYEMTEGEYSSVCIDNRMALRMACRSLCKGGINQVKYFSTSKDIYNFTERRYAFQAEMLRYGVKTQASDMIALGNTISEISVNARMYLQSHSVPKAVIMENYQVSIGVINALKELEIDIPDKIKMVGIDEVPEYTLGGVKLTQIKIPHGERAVTAVAVLVKEIETQWKSKNRIFTVPALIEGESV